LFCSVNLAPLLSMAHTGPLYEDLELEDLLQHLQTEPDKDVKFLLVGKISRNAPACCNICDAKRMSY
jgi:hypothetical protein